MNKVSHVGGIKLKPYHLLSPQACISKYQEWETGLNPSSLIWNTDLANDILTTKPNTHSKPDILKIGICLETVLGPGFIFFKRKNF